MRVTVIHELSVNERELYEFEVGNHTISYVGFYRSRRNNAEDTWGDEWNLKFGEKQAAEEKEFQRQHPEWDFFWSWDEIPFSIMQKYLHISQKYNPVMQRTSYEGGFGFPYLVGKIGRNLPKPKLTEKEIRKQVKRLVNEELKKLKLELYED